MTGKLALTTNARSHQALKGLHHGAHREHGVFTTKAQRHKGPTGIYHRGLREHGVLRDHLGIEVLGRNTKSGFSSVCSVFSVVSLALEAPVCVEVLDGGGVK